jgi:hypothetical protein
MSYSASATGFSLGEDVQLVLMFGILGRVDLKHVTGFHAQQTVHQVRVQRLGNTPLGADVPAGWNFTFQLDRGDSTADDLAATLETMYWNKMRLPSGQLYQYINEPNGSTSTYLFDTATLNLSDAGSWSQNAAVKQTLSGFASRRLKI